MKHITILAFAACCFTPSSALAQDCRPNKSGPDPITRQQVDIWWQVISSTGILKQALLDDDFSITATIGRYGLANAVNLELKKEIESLAKAAFESKYHAVKGNQFWCGLKDGPSLAFTATEVGNETHAGPFSGRIVTTLVLSARLTNAQLAAMKEVLIGKTIAAVRIRLAGDLQIDKTVSDNNGRNMQQKFGCFFQAMEKRGINISASTPPASQLRPPLTLLQRRVRPLH